MRLTRIARYPEIPRPLKSLCIANRGEIVHRIVDTASKLGIQTTSLYTEPDKDLPSATSSFRNLSLGTASTGYIDIEKVVQTAKAAGCDSIHPGYGFLSENAQFAKRVREEGLIFVGPPQQAIEAMGAKSRSKEIMTAANVPCVPGYHGTNQDPDFLAEKALEIGYPVLIKAILGGGGKGMRIVESPEQFQDQLKSAKSEAKSSFGDDNVLVEKYIKTPRHIEVQVFADRHGNVVALGERDCSVQRRHQKVLEESPAPGLDETTRQSLWHKAREAARAVGYEGAGTVEFIFDNDSGEFFFMEMNTRLQVEHPVTEAVTNTDLVEWQLLVAAGFPLPKTQEEIQITGHAFEARVYCEDPFKQFLPSSGDIVHLNRPVTGNPRLDITFKQGSTVSSLYDPMIGKLIVKGENREEALMKLNRALQEFEIVGPITNIEFLKRIIENEDFGGSNPQGLETGFIPKHEDVLFEKRQVPLEVYAQAAIARVLAERSDIPSSAATNAFTSVGSGWSTIQSKVQQFTTSSDPKPVTVKVNQIATSADGSASFKVFINDQPAIIVKSAQRLTDGGRSSKLRIEFEHAQFINSIVPVDSAVHVFHEGTHYTLEQPQPEWLAKALGVKEDKNSVHAPMPCKITRIHVDIGQQVKQGQELLVIESMKMETTIRSPQDGIIKRVVHKEGDIVKQGVALVEFEEDEQS